MKCIIFLTAALPFILAVVFGQSSPEPPGGYYKTRYDHLDVENILNQKRLVYYYSACLLNKGPCPPQGIEFKHILPEAIQTNCLKCTEKQRFVIHRTIRRLRKEYPNIWNELQATWDPTGEKIKIFDQSQINRPQQQPNNNQEEKFGIADRFADDDNGQQNNNDIPSASNDLATSITSSSSTSKILTTLFSTISTTPTTTRSNSLTPIKTVLPLSVPSTQQTTQKTTTTTTTTTNNNNINRIPLLTLDPVSFDGSVLITDPLKKLSNLGNKVVETGSRIAGVVIDTVQNVVGLQLPKVRIF